MTTHAIREEFNFTQKEFADFIETPLRTVQGWDSKDSMPNHVYVLCKMYLLSLHARHALDELLKEEQQQHYKDVFELNQQIEDLKEQLKQQQIM